MKWQVVSAVLLLLLVYQHYATTHTDAKEGPHLVFDNDATLHVVILTTPQERAQGLMYRTELERDAGFFFVFPDDSNHSFWMKNTYIPLDIIWLDDNFTVVHIDEQVYPTVVEDPPLYTSPLPARYVLEVNGGYSQAHGITRGSTARLRM